MPFLEETELVGLFSYSYEFLNLVSFDYERGENYEVNPPEIY